MKLEFWKDDCGYMITHKPISGGTLLGTIEVTDPKKVIHEEVKGVLVGIGVYATDGREIPRHAKNLRILYDIEE